MNTGDVISAAGKTWAAQVRGRLGPALFFYALGAALVAYNAIGVLHLDTWGGLDFWWHLAAIESLARDLVHPVDPYIVTSVGSHLFTPYHLLWALIVRTTGRSAFGLLPAIAAVNMSLFVIAIRAFASKCLGSARLALPLALAMLFLWLRPWPWSGFHDFGLLPLTSTYPYWFALSAAMIVLGENETTTRPLPLRMAALTVAVSLVFLTHPLTGSFLALALVCRGLSARSWTRAHRAALVGSVLGGLGLALAWPYFPVLSTIASAPNYAARSFIGDWREFYNKFPIRLLPAGFGLVTFAHAWRRRSMDWMAWTFVVVSVIYLVNAVFPHSAFLSRFVIHVALLLQWGTVIWFRDSFGSYPAHRRALIIALAMLVWVPCVVLEARSSLGQFSGGWRKLPLSPAGDRGNQAYFRRFKVFSGELRPESVVMAPLEESWILPAVVGCRVVGMVYGAPLMVDFEARRLAVSRFFDPQSGAGTRDSILRVYRATHVLVPREQMMHLEGLSTLARPVLEDDRYVVLRVDRNAPSGARRLGDHAHLAQP